MLDGRAQFANVAGPVVSKESVHCIGGQIEKRFIIRFTEMPQKTVHEKRNIFLSFAQRRHGDSHHVQAKEQIVTEFSLLHQFLEVLICRRHHPRIRAQRLIAADPLESMVFAHDAEQFHLRVRIDLADFIEENRAAGGLLESSNPTLTRSGKRSSLVPKQFTLEQLRRERRAMHDNKSRLVPTA